MIIQGKPELGLQKHQQEAYQNIKEAFDKRNKASVIIPTGCGKSFVSLQLMVDNKEKNILFMAPSNAIKYQMYEYIAKYVVGEKITEQRNARMITKEYFPNLKIILYPNLLRLKDEIMQKLNPNIIILDELHRIGAEKWGEKIDNLISMYPESKILGLTATPERTDDKDVVDEIFEGKIDYELTLVEAIKNNIVKPPMYVKCDYALMDSLNNIKLSIDKVSNETAKKELQSKYDKMRRIIEKADGISELFDEKLVKKDGKYIIFCKDRNHMTEIMKKSKEWFANIDSEPEMYSVYSGLGYSEKANMKAIKQFEKSESKHLKLLFSIDMLNEGLHVEGISGVVMARPTDSRIIYLQQLGRALSSDTKREQTIVFDLVNNYLKNNLDAEINQENIGEEGSRKYFTDLNGASRKDEVGIDIFRIQGETKEFLDLLSEVQDIIGYNDNLTNAINIKKWMERTNKNKPPSPRAKDFEEKKLGIALGNIKYGLIKKYTQLKTREEQKEFIESHPDFEEIQSIIKWIDENSVSQYLKYSKEIKQWMEEKSVTKPPRTKNGDKKERELGQALLNIRTRLVNPYMRYTNRKRKRKF